MTEPIIDIDGEYWQVDNDSDDAIYLIACFDPTCDGRAHPSDGHPLFIFDRANATRLTIALATALAGKPVPSAEMGDQLSLFDVKPHAKRYVDTPSWPPEPA